MGLWTITGALADLELAFIATGFLTAVRFKTRLGWATRRLAIVGIELVFAGRTRTLRDVW